MERCEECSFEYDLEAAPAAARGIAEGIAEVNALVASAGDRLRQRPQPSTWSPLEYACHLRDVLLVQRERVLLGRRAERPSLAPMGRDERVEHDGYAEQDAADVTRQLKDAAQMFGHVVARLGPDDWKRTVMYNYPTPQERSLAWLAAHTLHEVRHHALDVRRQVGAT